MAEVNVEYDGTTVLALGFNCERIPYVVRTGKDSPSLEVPWREGTRIATATRSQLIRMSLPLARAPTVELRTIMLGDPSLLVVIFFVVPPTSEPLMLPAHRTILQRGGSNLAAEELTGNNAKLTHPHPVLKEAKDQGVYLYGPAELVAKWRVGTSQPPLPWRVRLTFEPGAVEVLITDGLPPR